MTRSLIHCLTMPILALPLIVVLGGSARPQSAAADPETKVLIVLENQWLAAARGHDIEKLRHILAPEFIDTTYTGDLLSRDKVLKRAKSNNADITSQTLGDLQVRIYGDLAVVTGINKITGRLFGNAQVRFTDIFVRRNKRWQAVAAEESLVKP